MPITLGLRWQGVSEHGLGAYLDFLPTAFGFRSTGDVRSWDGTTRRVWNETRLVPGVMAGAGLQLTARESYYFNYGLRYHFSARPAPRLEGLSQMGFELSFDWRPPARW